MTGVAEPSGDGVGVMLGVDVGVTGVLVGMGSGVLVGGMVLTGPLMIVVGTAVFAGGVNVAGMLPSLGICASWARVGMAFVWHPTRNTIVEINNKNPVRMLFIIKRKLSV